MRPMDVPEYMSFTGRKIELYIISSREVVGASWRGVLKDARFEGCTLRGPLTLQLENGSEFVDCTFPSSAVEVIDTDKRMVGVVIARNCSFKNCEFEDIRIIVPPGHPLSIEVN